MPENAQENIVFKFGKVEPVNIRQRFFTSVKLIPIASSDTF
jgi:hypothetical protein